MTAPAADRPVVAFGGYLALAIVFLWPLSASPTDSVAYVGDSLATVYFIAENGRRLFSNPLSLFDAGIAFPHEQAALFEAHRLLPAFVAAPFIAVTANPILVVNLLSWMAYAFNAWSVRRLALFLGVSPVASFGAGALFAFNTYAVLEQPRLNIILLGFIPLALVETIRFARSGESKWAFRAAAFWLAQAYTENYSAIYGGALITFVLGLALFNRPDRGVVLQRVRAGAGPAIAAGLLFLPVAIAYSRMDAIYDFRREPPSSMDLSHFFATQPGNWLYGKLGPPVRAQQMSAHFIGFGAFILGLFATWKGIRGRREDRLMVLGCGVLATALVLLAAGREVRAFGYSLMPGPYGFLFDHVPLFTRTRIPERFGLLAMLPIALLAARGVDLVKSRSRVLHVVCAAFLSLEHAQRFPWTEALPVGADIPPAYGWLRNQQASAVVEAPAHGEGLVRMESVDMYFQLFHRKPVLSAYVSFPPLLTRLLRQTAEELPDRNALRTLALAGVDTILYHQDHQRLPDDWSAAESSGAIVRRASFPRSAFWLRPSGHDLVFGIPPHAAPVASSSAQAGRPIRSPAWRYRAAAGRAALAGDGDPDTQWILEESIRGGESIEIGFAGETVALAGLSLPLTRRDILPTRFVVEIRDDQNRWNVAASYGPTERALLVRDLMRSPGRAVLTLDLLGRPGTGLRLVASPGARSFDGWRLSEIQVLVGTTGLK